MVSPEQGSRISKIDTYLNCAVVFAYRSTCIKRKYGAVIVKDGLYLVGVNPAENYIVIPAKNLVWVQGS